MCSLNLLIVDELQLAEEEMKAFKIPSAKKIAEKRKSGVNKLKMGDTTTVDRVIGGTVATSGLTESSLKTTPSWKRAREEEGDNIVLRIPRSTSSYSDARFLESVRPYLLLPEDESCLSAIGLVQAADS